MDEIDWESLYHQMVAENEGLRLDALRRVNTASHWLRSLTMADVRAVVSNPVFWLGIGVGVILAFSYGVVPMVTTIHHRER